MTDISLEIPDFDRMKITTQTIIITLSNGINIDSAFQLLPITRTDAPVKRMGGKIILPHHNVPGSILSMCYNNNVRGIFKGGKSFRNAVTIDLSGSNKNINLKLCSFSIQISGSSTLDDGIEGANFALNHLQFIQYLLNIFQEDNDLAQEHLDWVLQATRGEDIERVVKNYLPGRLILCLETKVTDHQIVKPTEYPDHLNKDIIDFFLGFSEDFYYHSDMAAKISYIPKIEKIIDTPLEIKTISQAMVNYNYNLGFQIDRAELSVNIDGRDGFISNYINSLTAYVSIELPYEPPPDRVMKVRKNNACKHTFLCYRTGSVTQSGPGGEIMKEAYYRFMTLIRELKPLIMKR